MGMLLETLIILFIAFLQPRTSSSPHLHTAQMEDPLGKGILCAVFINEP